MNNNINISQEQEIEHVNEELQQNENIDIKANQQKE